MWSVLSIIFILLALAVTMSFTGPQTFVAQKAIKWVNGRYGTDIELARFQYVFPDQFVLGEVFIQDERKDTLAYASEIKLFFGGFNSLTNTAHSRGVEAQNLKFYWTKTKGDDEFGFQKFVDKFSSGDTTRSSQPFGLEVSQVDIHNGRFWYEDKNCDDCFRMLLQNIEIDASDFDLEGADFSLEANSISLKDKYSLDVKSLSTYYEMYEDHMTIEDLEFQTAESSFDGDVLFEYTSMEDFQDFVNKVQITAEIRESDLQSKEIQIFSGEQFPDFKRFSLTGSGEGTVNLLEATNLDLNVGSSTHLTGNLALRNTTYPDSIFINAKSVKINTRPNDIQFLYGLFSDSALPIDVNPLGDIDLAFDFEGYLTDFVTEAALKSDIGNLSADIALNTLGDFADMRYKGSVSLDKFNLGSLLKDSVLGTVTTNLVVDGKGTDPMDMNTKLTGTVSQIWLQKYNYTNIDINGRIKNGRFEGKLSVDDPSLRFIFDGGASFGQDTSRYKFTANVEHADLFALKLAPDSIAVVTAEMDIDFIALNYQKWAGDIRLFNTTYENGNNFYFFQDIALHSEGLDTNRYMEVRSNIVDANLSGNYTLSGIQQAFGSQINKFVKTADPIPAPENQDFIFDFTIKNTLLLTELFVPKLSVEPDSKLQGTYSSDNDELDIKLQSRGFTWDNNQVLAIDLDYTGGAEKSQLGFDVGGIRLKSGLQIDSIKLGNYFYNDSLFYDLSWIMRDSIDSKINLLGYALQTDTSTFEFGVFESSFNVGFQHFVIRDHNKITVDTAGVHIEDLVIANEGREIFVNGGISESPYEVLRLNLRGFGMDLANYFIGSTAARFSGKLYGDVILTQLLEEPKFAADIRIDSLGMNNTYLGDLNVSSNWTVKDDTIHLLSTLKAGNLTTFKADGFYQPDSLGTIKFNVDFDRFKIAAFNPFLAGIAEDARGSISGNVEVHGNTGTPIVNGELELPNTAFTVSLLKTDYNVEGVPKVKIEPGRISFPDLTLRDSKYGTKGFVTGGISHKNFRNFVLDLDIKADELLVLNTTEDTEDPYYGTAFVSGNIGIKGPIDEIKILADVTTERDTRFYLPIDGATEVSKTSFVTFVDPTVVDTLAEKIEKSINLNKGVSLDFNMNVNTNAMVSIIVDSDMDNKLEGRGYGNIRMKMNPYQDIEMYGTYTVTSGFYNFVMPGLKRKFDVLDGGTVTWNGDPFGAIIGLTARYTTKADPAALVNIYEGGRTTVILDMFLSGELFNPEINFDISAPRATGTVQSVIKSQLSDKDKMYRQVFSILALNQFAPAEGLEITGTSGQDMAFSALATQAAGYLNQVTGDYEVSLGYQGGTKDPSRAVQQQEEVEVGVSKRFFDDRITVNGTVGVAVGSDNTNSGANQRQVAGDFEVEYNVTDDGRIRAKVFNRSVDDYQYRLGQQNYEQGIGVYYRMDFETWDEFIQRVLHPKKDSGIKSDDEEDFLNPNEKGL